MIKTKRARSIRQDPERMISVGFFPGNIHEIYFVFINQIYILFCIFIVAIAT